MVGNESGQQTACMHVPGNAAQILAYPAYPAAEAVPGIMLRPSALSLGHGETRNGRWGFFRSEAVGFVRLCLLVVKKFPKPTLRYKHRTGPGNEEV